MFTCFERLELTVRPPDSTVAMCWEVYPIELCSPVGRCGSMWLMNREKQAIIHKQEDYLEYVIDRIIGQRPDPDAPGNMEFLIQWGGSEWEITDSTW